MDGPHADVSVGLAATSARSSKEDDGIKWLEASEGLWGREESGACLNISKNCKKALRRHRNCARKIVIMQLLQKRLTKTDSLQTRLERGSLEQKTAYQSEVLRRR